MMRYLDIGKLFNWWRTQWLAYTMDLISFWFGVWWAISLWTTSDIRSPVHFEISQIIPLWILGCIAASVSISHAVSIHANTFWRRRHACLYACGFWAFISALFFSTTFSITGYGIYGMTSMGLAMHAYSLMSGAKCKGG